MVTCLTLNWEFTAKLILNSLSYLSTYQMHKTEQEQNNKNHHNTRYMWFTPNVGATSIELRLYSTLYKNHSYDLRTQLQIFSAPLSYALSLQHLSYKTLCTLSYRGCPRTQLRLNLKPKNRP